MRAAALLAPTGPRAANRFEASRPSSTDEEGTCPHEPGLADSSPTNGGWRTEAPSAATNRDAGGGVGAVGIHRADHVHGRSTVMSLKAASTVLVTVVVADVLTWTTVPAAFFT